MYDNMRFQPAKKSTGYVAVFLMDVFFIFLMLFLSWKGFHKIAVAVSMGIAIFSMCGSIPSFFDGVKEKAYHFFSAFMGIVLCTPVFFYNLVCACTKLPAWMEKEPLTISEYIHQANIVELIFVAAVILLYFAGLFAAGITAVKKSRNYLRERRHGPIVEGPDKKQYWMPLSLDLAFEIFEKIKHGPNIPHLLLRSRIAELMYEDFKKGVYNIFRPSSVSSEDFARVSYRKIIWFDVMEVMHEDATSFWLYYKLYNKAKTCVDHMVEIVLSFPGYNGETYSITAAYEAIKLRQEVYKHLPENEKNPKIEEEYQTRLEKVQKEYKIHMIKKKDYEKRAEQERRDFELERMEQYFQQKARAEQERKLREQYEAKTKEVDNWFNAIASAQDGTVYSDWHDSHIPGDGVDADTYRRREFLRDEKKDQYRKEYEESLRKLDDE